MHTLRRQLVSCLRAELVGQRPLDQLASVALPQRPSVGRQRDRHAALPPLLPQRLGGPLALGDVVVQDSDPIPAPREDAAVEPAAERAA